MSSLTKKSALQILPPVVDRIDVQLDTVGDGSGTTDQSTTPAEYMYKPGEGVVAVIERMLVGMEDNAIFDANSYGAASALTNGIRITLKDKDGEILHDFTPNTIKKTWHWGLLAGSDVNPIAFQAGNDRALIRWTFTKAGGPLVINGDKGEYLSMHVQDTLADLVEHRTAIQGYKAL